MSMVVGVLVGRQIKVSQDPLGHWTYATYFGNNKSIITVLVIYQVHQNHKNTRTKAYHQQAAILKQQGDGKYDHRKAFI
eukprot:10149496-Ditylum_brightwellii.AAC.1